ncbi:MAG: hypothetical protein QXS10_07600, partial [Candidatus Bathyarchaeia archaeon]
IINFALDALFWIIASLSALIYTGKILSPSLGISFSRSSLLLIIVLFIPAGLLMDFIHESGHALWGVAWEGISLI